MATEREDVYATLLLDDSYLPGALVLAHSLRDAGTKKRLAVLVTTDTVSADTMVELQKLYDFVIPVERVVNQTPANLYLMNRADLHSTFTKIALWKQGQFRRIVYMDADMVALRAPDELFNIPQPFSAAPDIGWPDLFNTGLMVLNPNMGDYYALLAMAQRGISFDGADQGLLNMHFKDTYNRLSFTYNVTPSAHYQYLPAYRHFQSTISAAHFIGMDKPWTEGRDAHKGAGPYSEMVGRWWAVYDRHYRTPSAVISGQGVAHAIQAYTKGEADLGRYGYSTSYASAPHVQAAQASAPTHDTSVEATEVHEDLKGSEEAEVPQQEERKQFETPFVAWDPTRAPPPSGSKPEAQDFPQTHYEMSKDKTPFKAPEKYPEPPKDMWFEVPKTPTYQKPAPIFPWEKEEASKPTRVFAEDEEYPTSSTSVPTEDEQETSTTPSTPSIQFTAADPWQSFSQTRGNAWDEIPEIGKYMGALQKNRKGNIQILHGYGTGISQVSSPGAGGPSFKLTDFPTELERPSLPVTPAPIRRPNFWGNERDEEGELPAAEGVPAQADWDPVAQLEMLARRQSDVLAYRLGNAEQREIPTRPLPFGSEGVRSPKAIVVQLPLKQSPLPGGPGASDASKAVPGSATTMEQPSFTGPGAMWERDESYPTRETPMPPNEDERDILDN
ncbi:MAG: glycogenin glucosyltransferase [Claussenomyces sp. TS43310]|nr:MAG: glycogenin glucosyltransferase [Claussenomyces sp. TS43310]